MGHGTSVAMFDLTIPADMIKPNTSTDVLTQAVAKSGARAGNIDTKFDVVKLDPDADKGEWKVRIKKTMKDTTV